MRKYLIAFFSILLCASVGADNEQADPEQWYREAYGPIWADRPTERLDEILEYYAGYRAFLGLGFIIGAVVISILGDSLRSEIAITWSLFGVGGSIAVFAASTFLPYSPRALSNIGAVGVMMSVA